MSTSACLHGTVVKTDVLYLGLIYDRPLTGQPWHVQLSLSLLSPQDTRLKERLEWWEHITNERDGTKQKFLFAQESTLLKIYVKALFIGTPS